MSYPVVDEAVDLSRDPRVSVHVTTNRVVLAILALLAAIAVTVVVEAVGVETVFLRELLTIPTLVLLPGGLLLAAVGVDPDDAVDFVLYAVGTSVAVLMGVGLLTNYLLLWVGVARPISEGYVVASLLVGLLALTYAVWRRTDYDRIVHVDLWELTSPLRLAFLALPFVGVYGAYLLVLGESNALLVLLYLAIAAVPVLIYLDKIPKRLYPLVVWSIGLALLLQNTMTGNFLAWGDQPKEANIAVFILEQGYWSPSLEAFRANKFTMLRIVILHPIYKLVTGLEIFWVLRLIHPLVFSALPVALYQAYRRQIGDRLGLLSGYLYVSLFSFFVVLSRNTRTATAVLMLGLFLVVVSDRSLKRTHAALLSLLLLASVVVSHYGISYITLFGLVSVIVAARTLQFASQRERFPEVGRVRTGSTTVAFFVAVTLSWYIYASPSSASFNTLVSFFDYFFVRLTDVFISPSASASTHYVATQWQSLTLQLLKYYNVILGGLVGVGVLLTGVQLYRGRDVLDVDVEYYLYAGTFLAAFGVTFLPVERFNTARTYALGLLFFGPFVAICIHHAVRMAESRLGDVDSRQVVVGAVTAFVLGYFLLNSGLASALVIHEYSPNALVERNRVMDDGQPREQVYMYKQHPTKRHVDGGVWLYTHAQNNSTVFNSGWPGNPRGSIGYPAYRDRMENAATLQSQSLQASANVSADDYVFLGSLSVIGGTVKTPATHFGFNSTSTESLESKWANKSKIYANGGSAVYR